MMTVMVMMRRVMVMTKVRTGGQRAQRRGKRVRRNMTPAQIQKVNTAAQVNRIKRMIAEGKGRFIKLRKCPPAVAKVLRDYGINPADVMVNSLIPEKERYRTKHLTKEQKKERRKNMRRDYYRLGLPGSVEWRGKVYSPNDEMYADVLNRMEEEMKMRKRFTDEARKRLEILKGKDRGLVGEVIKDEVIMTDADYASWTGGQKEIEDPTILLEKGKKEKAQSREWLKKRKRKDRKANKEPVD